MKKIYCSGLLLIAAIAVCNAQQKVNPAEAGTFYKEPYRPQVHFSPREHWMNDPNGLVFYQRQYHLFFQYYPDSTVWGPMHWGHATSTDMMHWKQQPIALYPDSLGYIFSGSVVVDSNNTSGLGKAGIIPLIAIFTHHNASEQTKGSHTYQNQSLAYSLDGGKTWNKYAHNPVLKNPGITDFRDPKVSWYAAGKKWIMTLATKDRITFFSSPDLKNWSKKSEFGKEAGAHGGVWECPDLFPLRYNGKEIWVLLVSVGSGGPAGGSAVQYFTGDFDGTTFRPFQTDTRWIDYGADDYAGVTWSNTGNRKVFLGWMSNWEYAKLVPTKSWRSAMTLPRNLTIEKINNKYLLASYPVKELTVLSKTETLLKNINGKAYSLKPNAQTEGPLRIRLSAKQVTDFSIVFYNDKNEQVTIGFDKAANSYFIDRTKSGAAAFYPSFAARHTGPRLTDSKEINLTVILDNASIELFADNGLTTMTDIFFPEKPLSSVKIQSPRNFLIQHLEYAGLNSIWNTR